jgi:urea transporter
MSDNALTAALVDDALVQAAAAWSLLADIGQQHASVAAGLIGMQFAIVSGGMNSARQFWRDYTTTLLDTQAQLLGARPVSCRPAG